MNLKKFSRNALYYILVSFPLLTYPQPSLEKQVSEIVLPYSYQNIQNNSEEKPQKNIKKNSIDQFDKSKLIQAIIHAESKGNPKAYNKKTKATGLMQITPIVLKEWNQHHPKEKYSMEELFNPYKNRKVGEWYFNRIDKHYLPHYGFEKSFENMLAANNWGIGNLKNLGDAKENYDGLPGQTRHYIKKVKKHYERLISS